MLYWRHSFTWYVCGVIMSNSAAHKHAATITRQHERNNRERAKSRAEQSQREVCKSKHYGGLCVPRPQRLHFDVLPTFTPARSPERPCCVTDWGGCVCAACCIAQWRVTRLSTISAGRGGTKLTKNVYTVMLNIGLWLFSQESPAKFLCATSRYLHFNSPTAVKMAF